MQLSLLIVSFTLLGWASALPKFSWDKVPLYAHCGSVDGDISNSTAEFFSRLGFVTFEKTQDLFGRPAYTQAEEKIARAATLVKSFGTPTEVLMYYQNDWARTWYDSGSWFDAHPELELVDKYGNYVTSPIEYGHSFRAFDFSVEEAQLAWVKASMVLVDRGLCDGVFIDGYRSQAWRFEILINCTVEHQTEWIRGMDKATDILAKRLGPDRVLFNNPYSAARPSANGVMIEYFGRNLLNSSSPDPGSIFGDIKLLQFEGRNKRFIAAHMNSMDSNHFNGTLAAFLLGMEENAFIGTGTDWGDCNNWVAPRPEWERPLGAPLSPPVFNETGPIVTATRAFATGTHVRLRAIGLKVHSEFLDSCIWWSDGTTTGNNCAKF